MNDNKNNSQIDKLEKLLTPSTQPYYQYGESRGLFDPIGTITREELIGTPDDPGYYVSMRIGHPLIASIMDTRKNTIASTNFTFTGKRSERINRFFDKNVYFKTASSIARNSLSELVASIIDNCSSYGFSLVEQIWSARTVELREVDPRTVYEFIVDPDDRDQVIAVQFLDGVSYKTVDINKFIYITNSKISGNFWGVSDLRPLVQRWLCLMAEYNSYVAKSSLSSGLLYAQQIQPDSDSGTGSSDQSIAYTRDLIARIYRGQQVSGIMDPNIELKLLPAPNTDVLKDFMNANADFDNTVRQVLNANLNTLGLSSVGSKGLGEEIKANDDEKFEAYVERWLNQIVTSEFFQYVCSDLDVDYSEIGLTTTNRTSSEVKIDLPNLILLIDKGIITPDKLGEENLRAIYSAVGLDIESLSKPEPEVITEEAVVVPTPSDAVMAAAIALEVLSNTPVANRPTLSGSTTSRARKIASGAQLSELDKSRIKAFFSTHEDENSLEFGLNGGLAMKTFLESK
jgi:hypothetical protein